MYRFIFLLYLFTLSVSLYPIAVFHGITDGCDYKNTSSLVESLKRDLGVHVECIEIGNGFWDTILKSIDFQVEEACKNINANPNFQSDFAILGISQGTLIGRYIIEKCQMTGRVKQYLSLDGPQMGVGMISKLTCGSFCDWLCKLAAPLLYKLKDKVGPAGYFRYRYDQQYYMEHNTFLKMLNNENDEKDPEIYNRFSSLEKVRFIKSAQDTVIIPKDSSWFSFYDFDGNDIVPLEQSKIYQEDWIGLKKLNEEGKISFYEFKEEHVLYTLDEYFEGIVAFFKE